MIRTEKKKFKTIPEIIDNVRNLYTKTKTLLPPVGFRNEDLIKTIKELITLTCSLCIIFIDYNLIKESKEFLNTCEKCDKKLGRIGGVIEKLWPNRILLYNTWAFFENQQGNVEEALKQLFVSHNIIQKIKDSGGIPNNDMVLPCHLVTFIVLWKMKRWDKAVEYIFLALKALESIKSSEKQSRIEGNNLECAECVANICLSGVYLCIEKNLKKAIEYLENFIHQLSPENIMGHTVVRSFLKHLYNKKLKEQAFQVEIELEAVPNYRNMNHINTQIGKTITDCPWDVIFSKRFIKVLFLSCYVPHISSSTPLIRASELESYKEMQDQMIDKELLYVTKISESPYNRYSPKSDFIVNFTPHMAKYASNQANREYILSKNPSLHHENGNGSRKVSPKFIKKLHIDYRSSVVNNTRYRSEPRNSKKSYFTKRKHSLIGILKS